MSALECPNADIEKMGKTAPASMTYYFFMRVLWANVCKSAEKFSPRLLYWAAGEIIMMLESARLDVV